jgi:hypothetical protein
MDFRRLVNDYFAAEESGDVEAVVALCAPDVVIRNAAQPAEYGREGARQFASSFKARTEERRFKVLAVADEHDVCFAWWEGKITFKEGVAFGAVVAKRPFQITLQGVCRFKVDSHGLVEELDVFHETTSAVLRAQETAA